MKLSVLMITYNQDRYIEQAIKSVLMQQVDCEFEIVIGEDNSSDNTRSIVEKFHYSHPQIVRPLLRNENLGVIRNFVATFQACRGEYIALLEGDDYWSSPSKLQQQIDLLDHHPEYALCCHDVTYLYENGGRTPSNTQLSPTKEAFTLDDLLLANVPTCSVMFRNNLFHEFPEWIYSLKMADWPLNIFNAQHGDIGYIREVMGVYRVHQGGVYSSLSNIKRFHDRIDMYRCIGKHLGNKYTKIVRSMISKCYYRLAMEYEKSGDLRSARQYAARSILEMPVNHHIPYIAHLRMLMRLSIESIRQLVRTRPGA